jgi:predicted DCC family thiol-disulfide oxidoreductase YuxK
LVLFDGDCGFCRRVVEWARGKDARMRLSWAPFQTAPSPPMTPALKEACARAVHVLTPSGETLKAGRASLFVLEEIGYAKAARVLGWWPFSWFTEIGYRLVARRRRFFSRFF